MGKVVLICLLFIVFGCAKEDDQNVKKSYQFKFVITDSENANPIEGVYVSITSLQSGQIIFNTREHLGQYRSNKNGEIVANLDIEDSKDLVELKINEEVHLNYSSITCIENLDDLEIDEEFEIKLEKGEVLEIEVENINLRSSKDSMKFSYRTMSSSAYFPNSTSVTSYGENNNYSPYVWTGDNVHAIVKTLVPSGKELIIRWEVYDAESEYDTEGSLLIEPNKTNRYYLSY